jgi:transposase InsO family protein
VRSQFPEVRVEQACHWFEISRQAYYQTLKRQFDRAAEDELLLQLVRSLRHHQPRLGVRKLYHELQGQMAVLGLKRGRDGLFDLLRAHNLLVPVKRNRCRTTFRAGRHFPNLLADLTVTRIHQVWVADITYLSTEQGFLYLALLTDVFSRFIVGFDLSDALTAEGTLRALQQAGRLAGQGLQQTTLIHHSDHGMQYIAHDYLNLLDHFQARPSMGQVGNCYENALAERVNGILKLEYGLDTLFVNHSHANLAVQQAIALYNFKRPHFSLQLRKPAQVFFAN